MTDSDAAQICLKLARALDLGSITPRVIGRFSNLAVALDPLPIVARIATGTALIRDTRVFAQRESAIAGYLAQRGAAVIPPYAGLAGPHTVDGWTVTLWNRVDILEGLPDPAEAARRLAHCHALLREYPNRQPYFSAFDELDRILLDPAVRQAIPEADRAWIAQEAGRVRQSLASYEASAQPLHGDAHRKNAVSTAEGPVWTDWEDTIDAPVEWDLACLVTGARINSQELPWADAALAAYGPYDANALELCIRARALFGAGWLALLSQENPERMERFALWLRWLRTQ